MRAPPPDSPPRPPAPDAGAGPRPPRRPRALAGARRARARRAARAAAAQRDQFRDVCEAISDGILRFDEAWRFLYLNPVGERVLGRPAGALLGKVLWDEFPELEGTPFGRAYRRAMVERAEVTIEGYYPPFDAWFEARAFPAGEGLVLLFRDVTAQRSLRLALEAGEARYRRFFEGAGVSLWDEDFTEVVRAIDALRAGGVTDFRRYFAEHPEFVARAVGLVRVVDVNGETLRLFGAASKPELLASLDRIFVPETAAAFAEELATIAEGRTAFGAETALRTLAGERLEVAFTIRFPPPGEPFDHVPVSITDLTARRRAEAVLQESEARFRNMADYAPVMLWVTDARGACTYLSRRWYEYTGQTEATGLGLGRLGATHPDDAEAAGGAFLGANARREPFRVEYRLRRRDGAYRWVIDAAAPRFGPDGAFLGYVGSVTDIDARKRAEDHAALLARAGAVLSASFDAAATVQAVVRLAVPALADWSSVYLRDEGGRPRLVATAHVDPAKEGLLREAFERYGLADDAPHGYAAVLRAGRSELIAEVPGAVLDAIARDPEHRRLLDELGARSAMTVPLALAGRTFGAMTLVASESGRRYGPDDLRLAEELGRRIAVAIDAARLFEATQRERRRAEEANRAKDEFLSVASHELRTPLNAILGWSRMLRSGSLPEEKRERALETIERNAKAQVQLVEDILDVSRIITGKLRLDLAPLEPAHVIEAALDVVRPAAEAKGVRLQALLDPGAGALVGDAGRLQQIVWNLLSNAVKFTPKGGRVHVQLRREDSYVEIAVADTGRGIDPAFLPHVFEPFKQADPSATRSYGGLGLGLAIVKHLVELHGGTICAESEGPGRGAAFTVRIPVAPLRRTSFARPAPTPARDGGGLECPPELVGLRVLVVDDEPDARDLIKSILEEGRAEVVVATSAAEALDHVRARPPDVLVSDVGMPGEDGYSLVRKLRALGDDAGGRTPAVALTAYARAQDRTRALLEGFTSHVAKPVEPQELIAVVAALAGRRPRGGGGAGA
ncbi:MAG TPA: ATP-binding protein [Polyangiaceae bacterium]|nr:ATP-binding protein [Polyangiaceae bacterium]